MRFFTKIPEATKYDIHIQYAIVAKVQARPPSHAKAFDVQHLQ